MWLTWFGVLVLRVSLNAVKILENEALRLGVLPDQGASIAAFECRLGATWQPVMRPTLPGAASRNCSSYVLAPYSNRIRDGRFVFEGRTHLLPANWPDGQTIHGDVHNHPWVVLEESPRSLRCAFDSREHNTGFPFAYACRLTYELVGQELRIDLALQNLDVVPMPAGFGHHPYFTRFVNGEDARVSFRVAGVYLAEDALNPIPTGPATPISSDFDFALPRAVGDFHLDHVFNGWDGRFVMSWPGLEVSIAADAVFSHLVVYAAPDQSLAVEPVSHATDGFNLLAQGVPNVGVRVLQPGQTMQGAVRVMVRTH